MFCVVRVYDQLFRPVYACRIVGIFMRPTYAFYFFLFSLWVLHLNAENYIKLHALRVEICIYRMQLQVCQTRRANEGVHFEAELLFIKNKIIIYYIKYY